MMSATLVNQRAAIIVDDTRRRDAAYLSQVAKEIRTELVANYGQANVALEQLQQLHANTDMRTNNALENLQSQVAALRADKQSQSQSPPTMAPSTPRESLDGEHATSSLDAPPRDSHTGC